MCTLVAPRNPNPHGSLLKLVEKLNLIRYPLAPLLLQLTEVGYLHLLLRGIKLRFICHQLRRIINLHCSLQRSKLPLESKVGAYHWPPLFNIMEGLREAPISFLHQVRYHRTSRPRYACSTMYQNTTLFETFIDSGIRIPPNLWYIRTLDIKDFVYLHTYNHIKKTLWLISLPYGYEMLSPYATVKTHLIPFSLNNLRSWAAV